ncbi:MAG: hypothetical protein K1060chlam2_01399 [Chlamydiae bacterium]|nr:hypothetical protein [Chlamydiota bacterium]
MPNSIEQTLPFPNVNSPASKWQEYFKKVELARLDKLLTEKHHTGVPFNDLILIMYFMGQYVENFQINNQAKIENALSNIGSLRNKIEHDFDMLQSKGKTIKVIDPKTGKLITKVVPTAAQVQDAKDAIADEKQLKYLLTTKYKDIFGPNTNFVSNVETNLSTIFSSSDPKTLAANWYKSWHPTNPTSTGTGGKGNPEIQPDVNALTAIATAVSSQSSTAQSKIKFYESNDEQYKAMLHTIASAIINALKQANAAMQK